MAFRFRLCPNDTTAVLKEMFNATPLRVPEASVKPLLVIAEKDGKTDKRGELLPLLEGKTKLKIEWHEDPVSDINLEKTRSVNWDFGFKILEGFFQGFNIPGASVANKMSAAKEISLSFKNVRRRWIDKNELGTALKNRHIDLTHPSLGLFLGDDPWNMLLVTDVIVSNGFAINNESSTDAGFEAQIPAIQQIVNEANAKVQVKKENKNSITFEGADSLTFAFSCVKLEVNPATGALTVGTTVVTRSTEQGVVEVEEPEPVELDENVENAGMLEWD